MSLAVPSVEEVPRAVSTPRVSGAWKPPEQPLEKPPVVGIRGLDTLRAFAIVGVVAYHLAPKTMPGGYLGVDIFFVLSGFLITQGLCRTWDKNAQINFRQFFQKRFNRIVPSMVVVLLTCTTIALAVAHFGLNSDVLVGVDKQIYGAVSFTSNWFTILAGGDYFAATTPALFGNLWYLALNVQFYLLWPPLLVLACKRLKPGKRWLAAAGLGVASASLMISLSIIGAGQTRLYEGTDTHFFSLMAGAALALAFAYNRETLSKWHTKISIWRAGQIGWLTGCTLVVMFLCVPWASNASFRGLMVLAALLSVVLVYLLVYYPTLGAMLEGQPSVHGRHEHPQPGWSGRRKLAGALNWVGKHSYGIYLWHWPLLVIISGATHQLYNNAPWWVLAAVLAASVTFTFATEKLVNAPFASLGLRGYFHRVWGLPRTARIGIATVLAAGLAGTTAAAAIAPAESLITQQIKAGAEQAAATRPQVRAGYVRLADGSIVRASSIVHDDSYYLAAAIASGADVLPVAAVEPEPDPVILPTGDNITAIGDSVLLAATPQLVEQLPGVWIDGAVSRQFFHAAPIVATLQEANELRHYVVVALATNGTVTDDWINQLLDAIGPDHVVVLVSGYGDRPWIADGDAALAAAAERFTGQVYLADWRATVDTANAAGEGLLGGDGIHPNELGMERYAQLIISTLNQIAGNTPTDQPAQSDTGLQPEENLAAR